VNLDFTEFTAYLFAAICLGHQLARNQIFNKTSDTTTKVQVIQEANPDPQSLSNPENSVSLKCITQTEGVSHESR
jgi:hypothetical protein